MNKQLFTGPRDYLALIVRRKWWIIIPFLAFSCLVCLFAFVLPSMYVSETLILIQKREVPEEFVKDLIRGTTDERLSAIQQTILSRTILSQILKQFQGELEEFERQNEEQRVVRLRNQIKVEFEATTRRGETTVLKISYRNRNPELAQKITSRLASLFIEQDNQLRQTRVFGTTAFMSNELEKVSGQLQQAETELKLLKGRYRHELPDQLETNLRTLDRLGLQKQANAEALDRYASMRLSLERQISETPPFIRKDGVSSGGSPAAAPLNPRVDEYRKKEREYRNLAARYTAKHPDVQRAQAELERIGKDIPPEDLVEATQPTTSDGLSVNVSNPLYQSLMARLREMKTEFEIREKEKKWIESEIERYTQRVQNTPRTEQDVAAVLRTHSDLTKQYEDLKNKVAQARLAESLESNQKGSQFVIVDPAGFPLLPTKPNRLAIVVAGLALSLGASIALAFAVDCLNQKVWTLSGLENLVGVPVLVEIPEIVTAEDLSRARRRRCILASVALAGTLAYGGCLYLMYLQQSLILRRLEPLVERLMT
jgi:polysaccharide chain length determinant protein (PEP-CTERM system associated)